MTALREAPGTVPEKNRHRRPWKDGQRSLLVPIESPPEGEEIEGLFRVPARLSRRDRHTNDELEFQKLLAEKTNRWLRWRAMRGYEMTSKPVIDGPYDMPAAHEKAETDEDLRIYRIRAYFKRSYPAYIKLEDHLHTLALAQRNGIDLAAPTRPWNAMGDFDSGWMDPAKFAEERRQRLGVKRADYLFDTDLSKPLGDMTVAGAKDILNRRKKR